MDSIEKYAALLWGDTTDLRIREDVDSILGVPALERSHEDFERLARKAVKEVTKKKKKASNEKCIDIMTKMCTHEKLRHYRLDTPLND